MYFVYYSMMLLELGYKLWLIFPLYPWRDTLWLLLPTWLDCESTEGA